MKIGIPLYVLGLSFTMIKVYYDSQTVVGFQNKLIISLMADTLLVISVLCSFCNKLRKASVITGTLSLVYFYTVLGFGSRGSAYLACETLSFCQSSVTYQCSNLNSKPNSGVFFLLGMGFKIMAASLILRNVWSKYKADRKIEVVEVIK